MAWLRGRVGPGIEDIGELLVSSELLTFDRWPSVGRSERNWEAGRERIPDSVAILYFLSASGHQMPFPSSDWA